MRKLIRKGLGSTENSWVRVKIGYELIFRAAGILANVAGESGKVVKCRYEELIELMRKTATTVEGEVGKQLTHFLKVTRSYWSGLFIVYDLNGMPRTNNDLEHVFGSQKYHERRTSGRKGSSPGLVVRGEVRLPAATASRLGSEVSGEDLAPSDLGAWQESRARLDKRRKQRVLGHRFRKDPAKYLTGLEDALTKDFLPP